jgi:alpha-beta hydrolase superfamily lysophospholipase
MLRPLTVLLLVLLLPADAAAGARHWRLSTGAGAIHVLRPVGYRADSAGVVLYIHGFNTTVDRAWKEQHLASQLAGSGCNALFIAVAGPRSLEDRVRFPDLEQLLRQVARGSGLTLPDGPLVAMGHSGGYWTIAHWLDSPALDQVILLDGMYGFVSDYLRWVRADPRHRLVFVARGTARLSRRLIRHLTGVVRRRGVPASPRGFTRRERRARVLHIASQYGHSAIVRGGKVIPVVLGLTGLASRPAPGSGGRSRPR